MRSTVLAAAVSSAVALVGFAGAANASATVDLIWVDVTNTDSNGNPICLQPAQRNCPQLGTTLSSEAVAVTDNITLGVIITAGPLGILAAGVSVDYGDTLPKLSVTDFRRSTTTVPLQYLPTHLGEPNDLTSGWVQNINAVCCGPLAGIGLLAGATAYLGTVTFHADARSIGTLEIEVSIGDGQGGEDPDFDSTQRAL